MKHTWKNLVAAVILLLCLPAGTLRASALETDSEDTQIVSVTENITVDADLPDNEELYAGYIESLFYRMEGISNYGVSAREQLNPLGKYLYDDLKKRIEAVAAGESSSTLFTFSEEQLLSWGAQTSFSATDGNEALSAFLSQFDTGKVIRALLHDCPYELYWYDKVTGVAQSASLMVGNDVYTVATISFRFAVPENYQAADYDSTAPTVKTTAAAAAVAAADNAKDIVSSFAGYPDYEKLTGYRDAICSRVSYDKAAASGGNFSTDADPWQLISVFDDDSYTNVVCEGYSKAFQYLCDLTSFSGDVSCYTVTGTTTSGITTGGHMWNIVSIGGGNYLADVTNSDSGTVGQYGGLFLVGDIAGKTFSGYTGSITDGYTFQGVQFLYSDSSLSLWGTDSDSILRLAESDFNPAVDGTCGDSLSWTLDEASNVLVISGSGDMTDYDSTPAPWDHLTGRIASVRVSSGVTGIGKGAFSGCSGLVEVSLPDTLTSIGSLAFANSGLKSVTIPSSVSSMGSDVFLNCNDLVLRVFCGSYGETYAQMYGLSFERLHLDSQWETQVINPTCTEAGYTVYVCSTCNDRYEGNQVEALGHTEVIDKAKAATCTETGLTEGKHCSVCNAVLVKQETAPALGHDYKGVVTAPTCAERGYTTHTCTRCNDSYVDSYTKATGNHTYTDSQDTTCNVCGAVRELQEQEYTAVYRLYNPYTQEHLLTGEAEKKTLVNAGWSLDGLAWKAPTSGTPVYRLYNPYGDFHFYTTSEEEIATLTPLGWTVDGVVSYGADADTGRAVYRLFNPYAETNYHIFTASTEERDWLASLGWRLEGTAWYCMK